MLRAMHNAKKSQINKIQNNQKGFAVLEAIVIVVIIGVVGFTGWFVLNAKKSTDKSLAGNNSAIPTYNKKTAKKKSDKTLAPVFSKLPTDWVEYKSDIDGLRFGYPKEFGGLAGKPLSTNDYKNDIKNLQGRVTVSVSAKDGFSVYASKYGATIKPSSDGKTWTVSEENPAAGDGYKVGETYKIKNVGVNGGVAIDLTVFDEDCTLPRYLVSLNHEYAVVSIPELCPANLQPVTATSKAAYNKLTTDFIASITLY